MSAPDAPPPSYAQATGSSAPKSSSSYQARNGIPPERRRSMEDELRPLPQGWVRTFDPQSQHQFFVDTTKDPPRAIWHHPLDDQQYLDSLSPQERDHITRLHRSVSLKDIGAESSDDEDHHGAGPSSSKAAAAAGSSGGAALPPRQADQPTGFHKYTRRLKDRVTNSTHEERERERQQRAREEQQAYEQHMRIRQAFARAMETGQPQPIGKDKQGRDVYIESPYGPSAPQGAYGYNPYSQGPYANPNARFIRPEEPYGRPYGYGYGGGYGFPMMGGLLGGMMLGGLMF